MFSRGQGSSVSRILDSSTMFTIRRLIVFRFLIVLKFHLWFEASVTKKKHFGTLLTSRAIFPAQKILNPSLGKK